MTIVIVIDIYDLHTNGTVMTAYRFVEALRRRGHTVRVVATGARGPDCFEVPERYIPLATEIARKQQIRFGKPDVAALTNAFTGADVVHFYMPFKLEKRGAKIARMMDIPMTAAFHLQPENVTYNMGLRHVGLAANALYSWFRTAFYRKFAHIHCPSKFIAGQLKAHKYRAKLHVFSNGADADFRPAEFPVPRTPGRFDILMIGRYAVEKRQDVLIRAISLSKYAGSIHLTLAGRGPREKRLRRLAGKLLKNPVRFRFFDKAGLIEAIHASDLYVHTADVEIEAIACIEAFASGLVPVIADSPKSATPQFALDERSLFRPGSAKDLAAKIDDWIEHPEERAQSSKAYAELGRKYGLEYSISKAEEMFREAVMSHREAKKLNTREARRKGKKLSVKRNRVRRFLSWLIYYLIAAPLLGIFLKLVYGLRIRGRKHLKKIKKTGCVAVSNHVHLLDCAMNMLALLPGKVICTALPSNFDIPVAGKILKFFGAMPVPDNLADLRVFRNEVDRALKKHRVVLVYPEAHLVNFYAGLRPFSRGAFNIACDSQVPILPLTISWRKRRGFFKVFLSKKPCATITVGEPVYPELLLFNREMEFDLMERTRQEMQRCYDASNSGESVDYLGSNGLKIQEYRTRRERRAEEGAKPQPDDRDKSA